MLLFSQSSCSHNNPKRLGFVKSHDLFTEGNYCRFDWTINNRGEVAGYRWEGACKIVTTQ